MSVTWLPVIPVPIPCDWRDPADADLDVIEGEWRNLARCQYTDSALFFPEKGGSAREAKKVCGGCEVRAECLDWALENRMQYGIWGGLSGRERRQIWREAA